MGNSIPKAPTITVTTHDNKTYDWSQEYEETVDDKVQLLQCRFFVAFFIVVAMFVAGGVGLVWWPNNNYRYVVTFLGSAVFCLILFLFFMRQLKIILKSLFQSAVTLAHTSRSNSISSSVV